MTDDKSYTQARYSGLGHSFGCKKLEPLSSTDFQVVNLVTTPLSIMTYGMSEYREGYNISLYRGYVQGSLINEERNALRSNNGELGTVRKSSVA